METLHDARSARENTSPTAHVPAPPDGLTKVGRGRLFALRAIAGGGPCPTREEIEAAAGMAPGSKGAKTVLGRLVREGAIASGREDLTRERRRVDRAVCRRLLAGRGA